MRDAFGHANEELAHRVRSYNNGYGCSAVRPWRAVPALRSMNIVHVRLTTPQSSSTCGFHAWLSCFCTLGGTAS